MRERYFVLGAGKSGRAAARLALRQGAEVFLFDDREENLRGEEIGELLLFGAEIVPHGRCYEFLDISGAVIISPGAPLNHELILHAKGRKKPVLSELSFAFGACKAPITAITGTNGKTTTTALTAQLMTFGGLSARAGGNIGLPFSDFADALRAEEIGVLEVSSFMLEAAESFRPRIAALLNITPDHLDRHHSFEEYAAVKFRIFERQKPSDFAILNLDDSRIRAGISGKIRAQKLYFSMRERCGGAYAENGKIYFGGACVCSLSVLKIIGRHNVENALAAVTAAKILGIENAEIEAGLSAFHAVSHRLELVAEAEGVKFYNDSKATNIDSTLRAAQSVEGYTALILGGSDKGYEYDGLFSALPDHIGHCYFTGAVKEKLVAAAERCGYGAFSVCGSQEEALERAAEECARQGGGGTVLFSPAAASFDRFKNFEHRGDAFKSAVSEYVGKNRKKV